MWVADAQFRDRNVEQNAVTEKEEKKKEEFQLEPREEGLFKHNSENQVPSYLAGPSFHGIQFHEEKPEIQMES